MASVIGRELSDSGAGLKNMQRGANLIGGVCDFQSIVGQGTKITITPPKTLAF